MDDGTHSCNGVDSVEVKQVENIAVMQNYYEQ